MKEEKTQLNFIKLYSEKVSFDLFFEKEFNKALTGLSYEDSNELRKMEEKFVFEKFQNELLQKVFLRAN